MKTYGLKTRVFLDWIATKPRGRVVDIRPSAESPDNPRFTRITVELDAPFGGSSFAYVSPKKL